jgi:hypothetical protein
MDHPGCDAASWVEQELAASTFRDERLGRRLRKLLAQLADAVGAPIPLACQDWANTKAAYRFLSNEAVSEAEILAGHSARRAAASLPWTGRSWCPGSAGTRVREDQRGDVPCLAEVACRAGAVAD